MDIKWENEQKKFDELVDRAHRRAWQPAPTDLPILSLRSNEIPGKNRFSDIREIMVLAGKLGVQLSISGGGYGCFNIQFNVKIENEEDLHALMEIPEFLEFLERAGYHTIYTKTKNKSYSRTQHAIFKLIYATNRKPIEQEENPLLFYGKELSEDLIFGILEVVIPVRNLNGKVPESDSNFLKKVWRNTRSNISFLKAKDTKIESSAITEYKKDDLNNCLNQFENQQAMLLIHGVANSYKDAALAAINFYKNIELEKLDIAPIFFSWNSAESILQYADTTDNAEKSESHLLESIFLLKQYFEKLSITAHSHGNKLLLRALTSQDALEVSDQSLEHAFLCAPDVDKELFRQKSEPFLRVFEKAYLYSSKNDLALSLAEAMFKSTRAGRAGSGISERLEVIDASAVSSDLSGHSYYSKSIPVTKDIFYALCGQPPSQRHGLRPVKDAPHTWKLVPAA